MKNLTLQFCFLASAGVLSLASNSARGDERSVVYEGSDGPGKGKHIVLISGDEEYRSEEGLPMLGKILAVRHGFKCTVLFAINPEDGTIDPNNSGNIPGLGNLQEADMMVIATRFRQLPDDQMKYIVEFVNSGKPILGLRTATHAFRYAKDSKSRYAQYDFQSTEWLGGFGQQVLGETWAGHYGRHGQESTRGVINEQFKQHPILKGVQDIWGPTDVYTVKHLTEEADILVYGQVLSGMQPTDPPNRDKPVMPLAWTKAYTGESGKTARVICTTMGASVDLQSEGLRRLLVNACYWGLGLEARIPEASNVDYVGEYKPTYFGSNKFTKGVRPSDHGLYNDSRPALRKRARSFSAAAPQPTAR